MSAVFESTAGQSLDNVRVPAFFTYNGFQQMFIAKLGGLSERMNCDRWVLGDAGQQTAIGQQDDALAGELLNIYSNDFVTTWRTALGSLRLKTAGRQAEIRCAARAVGADIAAAGEIPEVDPRRDRR